MTRRKAEPGPRSLDAIARVDKWNDAHAVGEAVMFRERIGVRSPERQASTASDAFVVDLPGPRGTKVPTAVIHLEGLKPLVKLAAVRAVSKRRG